MSDRTIFIGDLHGVYDETVALLKKLDVGPTDHVIFLGDYVDRGPENAKCCDLVRHRAQVQGKQSGILGNHEERHLEHEHHFRKTGKEPSMPPTHVATRQELKPEHYEWFRSLPLYLRVPEHNVCAVHAGAYPGRPIEAQDARHLLHVQMIQPYDKFGNPTRNTKSVWPSRAPDNEEGWKFWTHFWNGPETLIFGHSVLDKPLITEKCVGIDGGAVFGRQLHAYVLPEKKIVTVNGTIDYGKGRRGQQTEEEAIRGTKIRTFLIHDDVSTYS
jgi:predicted phosphodiesterase